MRLVNKGFTIFVVSLVLAAIVGTYGSDPQIAGTIVVIGVVAGIWANSKSFKVYVRQGGQTFHRHPNCGGKTYPQVLKHNQALRKGFKACVRCYGSITSDRNYGAEGGATVYTKKNSNTYHKDPNCCGMKNAKPVQEVLIRGRGYSPCSKCCK